jgi:prostaglandin-E synthase
MAHYNPIHPLIKWAQRKDRVFMEIHLQNIKEEKIDLTSHGFSFSGDSNGKLYQCNIEFFEEVVPEVHIKIHCRHLNGSKTLFV